MTETTTTAAAGAPVPAPMTPGVDSTAFGAGFSLITIVALMCLGALLVLHLFRKLATDAV